MNETINSVSAGQLYVVSAPSGAGKTSLVRALIEASSDTGVAVSHTTRPQRVGETDGVNYHFVDETKFLSMVEQDEFLEWAHVFGYRYGTSVAAAQAVMETGDHLILEIDWQGAQQIREKVAGTRSIFILPPSLAALRDRLHNRAQDDQATVEKRMSSAFEELIHFDEFDYLIVNDNFDTALGEMRAIVADQGEQYRRDQRLSSLQPLIAELLPQKLP